MIMKKFGLEIYLYFVWLEDQKNTYDQTCCSHARSKK